MCVIHSVREVIIVVPEGSYVVATCFSCDAMRLRPVTAADARVLPIVGPSPAEQVMADDFALAA